MSVNNLKRLALAAALSLSLAFAYRSLARVPAGAPGGNTNAPAAKAAGAVVLHGKGVARFGGYALDISFTPDGRLVCFGIKADTPRG